MVLYLARAPPQVCAPTRHNHQFFPFAGFSRFWPKNFKTPCVPDGCIYRSTVLGREDQVSKVSFDIILSEKIFEKKLNIFTAKSYENATWAHKLIFLIFGQSLQIHVGCICGYKMDSSDLNWSSENEFGPQKLIRPSGQSSSKRV